MIVLSVYKPRTILTSEGTWQCPHKYWHQDNSLHVGTEVRLWLPRWKTNTGHIYNLTKSAEDMGIVEYILQLKLEGCVFYSLAIFKLICSVYTFFFLLNMFSCWNIWMKYSYLKHCCNLQAQLFVICKREDTNESLCWKKDSTELWCALSEAAQPVLAVYLSELGHVGLLRERERSGTFRRRTQKLQKIKFGFSRTLSAF